LVTYFREKVQLQSTFAKKSIWPNYFYTAVRGWLDGVSSFLRALPCLELISERKFGSMNHNQKGRAFEIEQPKAAPPGRYEREREPNPDSVI
jgi:hypothetical protein